MIIVGWAGNAGGRECACGEINRCDGGPGAACNCDSSDAVLHVDEGLFIDKDVLPVSEVCFGYKLSEDGSASSVSVTIGEFVCGPEQFGTHSCVAEISDCFLLNVNWA